jgi:hypothetical protein
LLNPPVDFVDAAADEAVGFVADDVEVPGRLAAATPGARFGGTFSFTVSFLAPFSVGVSGSVSTSDATGVSSEIISAGASLWEGAS